MKTRSGVTGVSEVSGVGVKREVEEWVDEFRRKK
jgi:hypothetical protein